MLNVKDMNEQQLRRLGFRPWDLKKLMLIPADRYEEIPDGTVLTSVLGATAVKGWDVIDLSERMGVLAFGVYPRAA